MATTMVDNGIPQAEPPRDYSRTGGEGPAYRQPPKGPTVAKVDMYGWSIVDAPGCYKLLNKALLNIDHDYQRESVNQARVNRIASKWSWIKFNAIAVAQRPDGTYYVLDGQHRKLGADKRADIENLPCIVFKMASQAEESAAFLAINGDRGTVKMVDKFRSLVASQDDIAVNVDRMVTASGYEIAKNMSGGPKFIKCISTLMVAMKWNKVCCKNAWTLSTLLCGQDIFITDKLFKTLFHAERHLQKKRCGSITDQRNVERLVEAGHAKVIQEIDKWREVLGEGPGTGAEAIVRLLNYKRKNRIPSTVSQEQDEE